MSKEVIKTQHSELHKRGSRRGSLKELFVSATVLGKGADSKDDRSIVLCCGDAGESAQKPEESICKGTEAG